MLLCIPLSAPVLDTLRTHLDAILHRAHVPFSKTPVAAVLLLTDGTWVPGVRIESASFSLTLPALLNAYTTLVSAGRPDDLAAAVLSRPFRPEERTYLDALPLADGAQTTDRVWTVDARTADGALPQPTRRLDPTLSAERATPAQGLAAARTVAARAHVPASGFPVGAVLESEDGSLLPGVNVEHPDWARILCAERNALGTAWSYGLTNPARLFLTCLKDAKGTPCGACRQLLAELTPEMTLWMDRHMNEADTALPTDLLPGSFRGDALLS